VTFVSADKSIKKVLAALPAFAPFVDPCDPGT